MAGINTKAMDPVKTQIMESATIRNDFDACVNLYKDFIEQSNDLGVHNAKISLVHSDKNGAPSGSGGGGRSGTNYEKFVPDNSVPKRYYTGEEYQALNDSQKKGLKLKRANRGHNHKVEHGRTPSGGKKKLNMELSKPSIAALVSALASQTGDTESTKPTPDTEIKYGEVPMKRVIGQKSNHTNKALLLRKN